MLYLLDWQERMWSHIWLKWVKHTSLLPEKLTILVHLHILGLNLRLDITEQELETYGQVGGAPHLVGQN